MWPHQKSSEMVSDSFQLLRDQHGLRIPKLQALQSRLQPPAELRTLPLIPEQKEKKTQHKSLITITCVKQFTIANIIIIA